MPDQKTSIVAYINRSDLERLLADKWAVVEVTAYEVQGSENIPLLVHDTAAGVPASSNDQQENTK